MATAILTVSLLATSATAFAMTRTEGLKVLSVPETVLTVNGSPIDFKASNTEIKSVNFNNVYPLRATYTAMGGVINTDRYSEGIITYKSWDRDIVFDINKNTIVSTGLWMEDVSMENAQFYYIGGTLFDPLNTSS